MSLWNFLFGTSVPFTTSTIKEFANDPDALSAISKIAASWNEGLNSNRSLNFINEDGKIDEKLMKEVLKQEISNYINNDINRTLSESLHSNLYQYLDPYSETINRIITNDDFVLKLTNNSSEIITDHNGAKEIQGYNGAVYPNENTLSSDS